MCQSEQIDVEDGERAERRREDGRRGRAAAVPAASARASGRAAGGLPSGSPSQSGIHGAPSTTSGGATATSSTCWVMCAHSS